MVKKQTNTYALPVIDGQDARLIAFLVALPRSASGYDFPRSFWKLCYNFNIFGEVLDEPVHIEDFREVAARNKHHCLD